MIEGMEHVGLSVADLDRSIEFYCGLLGCTVIRILECGPETHLGEVVGIPGARARIAHLQCGPTMIELFEYQEPRGRTMPHDHKQADHGLIHMGLTSSDVRAYCARLSGLGVRFISDPVEFRPGVWIVYFRGPDGEVCELRKTTAERPPRR